MWIFAFVLGALIAKPVQPASAISREISAEVTPILASSEIQSIKYWIDLLENFECSKNINRGPSVVESAI
jgi:hypothetical protein